MGHPATGAEVVIVGNTERMEGAAKDGGVGGRVAWIELELSFFVALRASVLFAEDDGKVRAVCCLKVRTWVPVRESTK